ncbi:HlyD family type I secretion periplasmic adaptor subunit [Thalassobaculum fulvum]|jgi:HlyD family type I secretion membrane fusion protein|uniref:Membrane fusion protein (MFP) family protein n=1 Tax=Thalassobaculum fulvum TaxID=1633335 RepID=A0A919CPG8_9PROT|nr:HlyD family type I secretion periplasmic adaptor subunit [Thalassobaculum fulvum]GHD50003.1 HlyD family type I secretion periplasmic adaptor subunit [Thalassobaculum fulvum]
MPADRALSLDTVPRGYTEVERDPNILDIRTFILLTAITAVIGVAVWMSFAKLDSATAAPGELRVESHRKTLKVLESGIVHRLLVSEGDRVVEGQPLIELDPTRANANVEIFQRRYYATQAQLARFQAEAAGRTAVRFPDSLLERADDPDIRAAMITEADLFDARTSALKARTDVTKARIDQLQSQIGSTDNQISATREQIAISVDELQSVEYLYNKNLIQKSRFLAAKRTYVDLKAKLSDLQSRRAQLESEVGATRLELLDIEEQARNEALTQVSTLQAQILELEQQIGISSSTAGLLTLKSPLTGTVVKLEVFSEGTVVLAGEPLMDIVPANDQLIVETHVGPDDIDNVAVGMVAKVRLSGLSARTTPLLEGKVTMVSADLASPKDAEIKYYLANVVLPPAELEKLKDVELAPGMQATVMIVKGERTVLDYLLSPIVLAAETAMREP